MADLEKNILVVIPVNEDHKKFLEEKAASGDKNCCIRYVNGGEVTKEDVEQADVIVGNVDPSLISGAKNLELLQLNSAGADLYIKAGVMPEGAVLANATGAYGLAVSEHMLGLTFDLIRRLNQYHANQAEHVWKAMGNIISVEGSTILVLGLGDIGGDYARKVHALGAHVIGVRRTNRNKPDYLDEQHTMDDLDMLLGRADIVAMVLPGGSTTNHIMDERRLRLMKKGAYLINVGRGNASLVHDVVRSASARKDHGLVITPHVAGNFFLPETFERIVRIAGENLAAWANGTPYRNVVDFTTGYRK